MMMQYLVTISYHGVTDLTWTDDGGVETVDWRAHLLANGHRIKFRSMREAISSILQDKSLGAEQIVKNWEKLGGVLTGDITALKTRLAKEDVSATVTPSRE